MKSRVLFRREDFNASAIGYLNGGETNSKCIYLYHGARDLFRYDLTGFFRYSYPINTGDVLNGK